MLRVLLLLFAFFAVTDTVSSQLLPVEGSMLNYTLIGFSFPSEKEIGKCTLEIAEGDYDNENSFKENIIKTLSCSENKKIVAIPFWGKQYTWRTINKAKKIKSDLHHFSTILNPGMDTTNVHLRIIQPAEKYRDAFVLLDQNKTIYDMTGNPIWFLPGKIFAKNSLRDLKVSPQGTITFLAGDKAYEVNYQGDILWQGPNTGAVSGDSVEHYHHEFTRLSNGHYMILGDEYVVWKPKLNDGSSFNEHDNKMNHSVNPPKSPFGTLIEYDEKGNVVWSWKSSTYFKESDLNNNTTESFSKETVDVHSNSFYFDEKSQIVYISFKNISRIIKLKYPEGIVTNSYGEVYQTGMPEKGNGMFCQQHSIRHSDNGYIYMFNNNSCNPGQLPDILIMQEPAHENESLKKIWEYECTIEGDYPKIYNVGGNVIELPDSSLFVSMGLPCSKLFIVNRAKKILWSALPESWNPMAKKWDVMSMYRGSIILNRKELEAIIWKGEDK